MTSFINKSPPAQYQVPADAQAMVVLIHGMAEHSARYARVAEFLNARGLAVCAFDQRGHGKTPSSERDRGDVTAFADFATDAAAVIEATRARYPQLPLFVWGHSMGAIIATLAVAHLARPGQVIQAPTRIRGVITSSPPTAAFDFVPAPALSLIKWVSYVIPKFRVSRPFQPERLSRDLQVGVVYGNDPLVPKAITLRLLVQLAEGTKLCLQAARKLRVPWLAMHGSDDEIAPAIGSQRLIDALGSADKQLRVWPGARHEVHNEVEPTRTEFLECMVAWVKERL